MQIKYCDQCNLRLDETDMVATGGSLYCKTCSASAQSPPQASAGRSSSVPGSSSTRPSTSVQTPIARSTAQYGSRQQRGEPAENSGGNKALVVTLSIAAILLAGAAIFLLTRPGANRPAQAADTQPAAPPKKDNGASAAVTPAITPGVKPLDPKQPAPGSEVDIMAGVREESARRALDKLIEDEKSGRVSESKLRKRYAQFLSGSYKSGAAAKEAQERLNALPRGPAETPPVWIDLDPVQFLSANNSKMVKADNGALLVTEHTAETEKYIITAKTDLKNIIAVRLEVLADDSLPARGPGRSPNGNFVLTDFKVFADDKPLAIKMASADFSQNDFSVFNAIDDKSETGWGIYPRTGTNHVAVFELNASLNAETLVVHLDQQSKHEYHIIGKFRLSVTASLNSRIEED